MKLQQSNILPIKIFALALVLVMICLSEQAFANTFLERLIDLPVAYSKSTQALTCQPQLIEHNCDDIVDGIDINCDRSIDVPLPSWTWLRLGQVVGPFPIKLQNPDIHAEEGVLLIPENRRNCLSGEIPDPRRVITLGFKRFRTKMLAKSDERKTPVFNLAGGPGAAPVTKEALESVLTFDFVARLLESRDIVLVEQRGMGSILSSLNLQLPALECPGSYGLTLKQALTVGAMVTGARKFSEMCADHLEHQGVDLSAYDIIEMVDDVNDLRNALSYEKISLLAGSFGSQHALALIRFYEDHIERAVLNGVEGLTQTMKWPSNVESKLELLSQMAAADPVLSALIARTGAADLLSLQRVVLSRLILQPATVSVQDPQDPQHTFDITIGSVDAQAAITAGLGSSEFLSQLPLVTLAAAAGDYSLLAAAAARLRLNQRIIPVNYLVDCFTGASTERRAQVRLEARQTTLSNLINLPKFGVCNAWGEQLPDYVRQEPASDIPILFVSGELDARTPESNAQELLQGNRFPNGQSLLIKGVSHDFNLDEESSALYADAVVDFLDGELVINSVIESEFSFLLPPL